MTADPGPAGVEVVLGPLADVPPGEGRAYAVGDRQVAVLRPRGGPVRAVQALCPHAGGPIADGQLDDRVVVCPLHARSYELATGAERGGGAPLAVYPVRVDDGALVVTLPPG